MAVAADAVAERDPGVHEVTALAHNPSKFDAIEKGLALQPRSINVLSDMPPAPTGLSLQQSLYRVKNQVQVLVQVSWNEVQTAVAYRLARKDRRERRQALVKDLEAVRRKSHQEFPAAPPRFRPADR
jgi:predicted phage tail protein